VFCARTARQHRARGTERRRQVRTSHEYVGCDCAHALVFGNVFGTLSRPWSENEVADASAPSESATRAAAMAGGSCAGRVVRGAEES
jgi:hypothetical protein